MKRNEIERLKNCYTTLHRVVKNSLGDTDWNISARIKKLTFEELGMLDLGSCEDLHCTNEEIRAVIEIRFSYEDMTFIAEGEVLRRRERQTDSLGSYVTTDTWDMDFTTNDGFIINREWIIDSHPFLAGQGHIITREIAALHDLLPSTGANSTRFKELI